MAGVQEGKSNQCAVDFGLKRNLRLRKSGIGWLRFWRLSNEELVEKRDFAAQTSYGKSSILQQN